MLSKPLGPVCFTSNENFPVRDGKTECTYTSLPRPSVRDPLAPPMTVSSKSWHRGIPSFMVVV
jgi:hypothetical protein